MYDIEFKCVWFGRVLVMEYEKHLSRIGRRLLEAMAKNLELNIKNSKEYLAVGMMRVYRYPNCPDTNGGWGMEAHTDSSVMSILNQGDEVGGLQLLKHHQWLNVKPIPDTLIVNLGDMMQVRVLFLCSCFYGYYQHRFVMLCSGLV